MKQSRVWIGVLVAVLVVGLYAWWDMQGSTTLQQPTASSTMIVKIPLLVDASNEAYSGPVIGCDKVILTPKEVPTSAQVLGAAMQKLFAREDAWEPWSGKPSNFLSAHPELAYDHAVVVDGAAKIYLTGSVGPLGGVCDDPRLRTTLEQTALQFSSVTSVQFYLNGKATDFNFSEK